MNIKNAYSLIHNGKHYETDKTQKMINIFYEQFEKYKNRHINILELGVKNGGSMLLWNDYFKKCNIAGLDLDRVELEQDHSNLNIYQGSQSDLDLLDKIRKESAPDGFDIIIDDCSHIAELTKISFWHIFNKHLKNGGLYVIEDWGCGYWDKWPDGHRYKVSNYNIIRKYLNKLISYLLNLRLSLKTKKKINWLSHHFQKKQYKSHSYGMVGLIKELIDECGMRDITSSEFGIGGSLESKFEYFKIYPGAVFIKKK